MPFTRFFCTFSKLLQQPNISIKMQFYQTRVFWSSTAIFCFCVLNTAWNFTFKYIWFGNWITWSAPQSLYIIAEICGGSWDAKCIYCLSDFPRARRQLVGLLQNDKQSILSRQDWTEKCYFDDFTGWMRWKLLIRGSNLYPKGLLEKNMSCKVKLYCQFLYHARYLLCVCHTFIHTNYCFE